MYYSFQRKNTETVAIIKLKKQQENSKLHNVQYIEVQSELQRPEVCNLSAGT